MLRKLLANLMQRAQRLDRNLLWDTLTLHLVDDAGMQAAHQDYFGKQSVTDVISQRYPPLPGEPGSIGEIIVNTQQAARTRQTLRWSANHELVLYIAHGIDHLHGATDDTTKQQQTMRRRELRWLQQLQQNGLNFTLLGFEIS